MQKFILLLFVIVLHLLWFWSIKIYYKTTYRKYLETQSNFNWEFVFKNKSLPSTEDYAIFYFNRKIGTIRRTYSQISNGFTILTLVELEKFDTKLFNNTYSLPGTTIKIVMDFDIFHRIKSVNIEIFENFERSSRIRTYKNALLHLYLVKRGEKLDVEFTTRMFPVKNFSTQIDETLLNNSINQNFIFFGSRPAVGKSWTIKLGTFNPIEAVVEEKFIKKIDDKEVSIYSVTYSSDYLSGYSWVDENGELLKLVLYKPPISIIKEGTNF